MSSRQLAFIQKRRSTRIYNAIPLAVKGSDAFRAPYLEEVSTIAVNCHGCRYQSKYEAMQGEIVNLQIKPSSEDSIAYSCQARVKWLLRTTNKDPRFEIAVELVDPGNIWGIVSPPADWFPIQETKATERRQASREQPLATRIEQQIASVLNEESVRVSHLERDDPAAALSPLAGQLVAGLGKQIQIVVAHAATAAFVKERDRLIGEFRSQLQAEATRTSEYVISTSKEELTRRVLPELNNTLEAAARSTYERWNKQIDQKMKEAEQSMLAQATEVTRRVEGMSVGAIERLQRNMEASRTEAVELFLSRLREQVAPLLENARVTLQNLSASENKLKDDSRAMLERFDNFLQQSTQNSIAGVQEQTVGMLSQFESDVANSLADSQNDLRERSAEVIADTTRMVRELSKGCEEAVRGQLASLVSAAADDVTCVLNKRSAEISGHFSSQLERNTRSYLDFISKSIAQIPKETVNQSGD